MLRAVCAFLDHPDIGPVVVVLPPAEAAAPPDWLVGLTVRIVAGGAERGDSVWNGLQALPEDADPILVHDGARPFVSSELISRVALAARTDGAITALPAADTLKRVTAEGQIEATLDRTAIWQAQTPQGFPRDMLLTAYRRAREDGVQATDEAALVERTGGAVRVVLGSPTNMKITHPGDVPLAEALARMLP